MRIAADLAQVAGHRSAQGQLHHVLAGFLLEAVDRGVGLDHAPGGIVVAQVHHGDRGEQLVGGHAAHAQQFALQALLLLVHAPDDVFVRLLGVHPNLPVM